MTTRLLRAVLLAAAAILLAGCQRATDRAEFVFMNGAEPETLDPSLITGQPEARLAGGLFEGLTSFDEHGQVVPGVAEKWDLSPDGRVYTFHFRKDARWSNGDPVTARDFRDTWRRTLAPETASEYAYQLYYIHNGRPFNEGALKDFSQVGVAALDDRTLEVTLDNPTPFFLDLCATSPLYPVHLRSVEKWGDDWIKPGHLVGNGPYVLDAWRINDRVRLVKNPFYWDAAHVGMKTIDALPTNRANTAYNFYAAGQADLIMDKGLTPLALIGDLRKRPDFHAAPSSAPISSGSTLPVRRSRTPASAARSHWSSISSSSSKKSPAPASSPPRAWSRPARPVTSRRPASNGTRMKPGACSPRPAIPAAKISRWSLTFTARGN